MSHNMGSFEWCIIIFICGWASCVEATMAHEKGREKKERIIPNAVEEEVVY